MILQRETGETRVRVAMAGDATSTLVQTGNDFLDHMLETMARYAGISLEIQASGDLKHHLIEDVAITLGRALKESVPPSAARYAHRVIPMDDALVEVALDLGGRPFYRGRLPSALYDHWMRSFADNAGATLHVVVRRGRDRHHIVEAAFKALGLALRDAMTVGDSVFSTKGSVCWERSGEDADR